MKKLSAFLIFLPFLLIGCSSSTTESNSAPTASSVIIADDNGGSALVGDVLSGSYSYADADGDAEGSSTFRWLRDGSAISDATAASYTLVLADSGTVMTFEVMPVAASGTTTGDAVTSSGLSVSNSAPTASSVSITDNNGSSAFVGNVLSGNYSYADVDGDAEGSSTFRWLRDGSAISGATTSTYIVVASDELKNITFEVAPIAATGTTTGSAVTSSAITIAVTLKPLNDTGITTCGDYAYTDSGTYATTGSGTHNNNLDCSIQATVPTQTTDGYDADGDIIRAGQDALYGRDVTNNDNIDGYAGFSFTKLDSSGNALANQSQTYAENPWACVKDNVTGLTWEVKTLSGLQLNANTYTWYNSDNANNGGSAGTQGTDTEQYAADVNASNTGSGICGATDWRLPSKHELVSIVKNSSINPAVDANYFPNTVNSFYWSSSPYAGSSGFAWFVGFLNGNVYYYDKNFSYYVRLVRGSQ